jgi:hypothetical protein
MKKFIRKHVLVLSIAAALAAGVSVSKPAHATTCADIEDFLVGDIMAGDADGFWYDYFHGVKLGCFLWF